MLQSMLWIALWSIVCMLSGLFMTRYFHVFDKPWKDVPKRLPVPTIQWIVLLVSFFTLGYIFLPESFALTGSHPFFGMLVWSVLIAGISFVDELGLLWKKMFALSSKTRLIAQILVIVLVYMISGVGIDHMTIPGLWEVVFGPFNSILLTVAWYVLFINALNRFDGISWLASGTWSLGFLTIFLLLLLVVIPWYGDMTIERLSLLQDVSLQARLLFCLSAIACVIERKPWWLLRDVGTMCIGFCLAYLWLLWGAKIGMLVVVLALPLFDAVFVIVDRLHRRKKNPFHGDHSHLHYRLLALGWTRNEVRCCILGATLFLMILMLLLDTDRIAKIILFVLVACIFFGVHWYLYWVKGLDVEYKTGREISDKYRW